MASRTAYMYEDDDLQRLANQIKELTVSQLQEEGLVEKDAAEKFLATRLILVARKGLLGKGIDRVLGWIDGDRDQNSSTFMFASIEAKRKG